MSYKVLTIGDSLTAGFPLYDPIFGGDQRNTYQYWAKQSLIRDFPGINLEFVNQGICGEISEQIIFRLRRILDKNTFDAVFLWAGANDVCMGVNPSKIYSNIKIGVQLVTERLIPIVVMTIPLTVDYDNQTIIAANSLIRTKLNDPLCSIIDVEQLLSEDGKLKDIFDIGDGVHLNINAYKVIGSSVEKRIIELFSLV